MVYTRSMAKRKRTKSAAETTGSEVAKSALLRTGAGKHGDSRLSRLRTRKAKNDSAINDSRQEN
jgi:hypothetical protein